MMDQIDSYWRECLEQLGTQQPANDMRLFMEMLFKMGYLRGMGAVAGKSHEEAEVMFYSAAANLAALGTVGLASLRKKA